VASSTAIALRAEAWEPLIKDDGAGILMAPLFLFNSDIELADSVAEENELLAEASDMVPACVAANRPRSQQVSTLRAPFIRRLVATNCSMPPAGDRWKRAFGDSDQVNREIAL
jgi:hypothetical protein